LKEYWKKTNVMKQIISKESCVGCNACGDICPKQAIVFETGVEGFWYPKINNEKCNDCGLCQKACPVIHSEKLKTNDLPQSVVYAAEHKNLEVIFDSTSGGAFSACADIIYKQKGFVGGAIFNDDFSIRHYVSNDKQDLPKLRSSKYAQSDLSGFYSETKKLLESGESVLVCGCPCQMAGMRSFLGKDYDNLIITDFICRGINSPMVWRKYLESFEERYGSPVVYAKAKSKEYGWRNLTQKVILKNGEAKYETRNESLFTIGYLQTNAYCRPSCYDCKFKGFPRIADITFADFWSIEKYNISMEKNLGTSMVMLNSQKGVKFFETVKARMNCIEMDYGTIFEGNLALVKSLDSPKVDRAQFFADLNKMTFTELAKQHFNLTPKVSKIGGIKGVLRKIKATVILAKRIVKDAQFNITAILQSVKYSKFSAKGLFLSTPHCIIEIHKTARIALKNGSVCFGVKGFKKSRLETRLLLRENATLDIDGNWALGYGGHVEVHKNATLKVKDGGASNIALTIICADKIEIGKGVMVGRGVTIRDNNGGHYLNRQGYKNSSPVVIGDKVWLCEGCTIMSGVHIGDGAIIGAHAFVTSNVPANALVSGNPARIIDRDVLWKY